MSRLFLACWPESPVCEQITSRCKPLLDSTHGRSQSAADLHMTLAFLGDVDASRRRCVEMAMGALDASRFSLRLEKINYWSGPGVVWLGPDQSGAAFESLVLQIRRAVSDCGLPTDCRPPVAHLTLLRGVKGAIPEQRIMPIHWDINGFYLVRSCINARVARYERLMYWPFC